ncbi:hypothetical protein PR048_030851 [Dryococelus australis]|uniref:Uncharacterized protein n=1 Tax=Dryococelus australis TaxID=614101 RepID=A0ABQ9GDX5_9NEOP|nr:hypothetical protein PR048_030851 [Dryococelus australis]
MQLVRIAVSRKRKKYSLGPCTLPAKRRSDKGNTAMRIKCTIASKCKSSELAYIVFVALLLPMGLSAVALQFYWGKVYEYTGRTFSSLVGKRASQTHCNAVQVDSLTEKQRRYIACLHFYLIHRGGYEDLAAAPFLNQIYWAGFQEAGGGEGDHKVGIPPPRAILDTGWIWAAFNIEILRADQGEARLVWSSAGMQGCGNGRSPRRPADQRHRPARFPHAEIRERPRKESNPVRLGGNAHFTVNGVYQQSACYEEVLDWVSHRSAIQHRGGLQETWLPTTGEHRESSTPSGAYDVTSRVVGCVAELSRRCGRECTRHLQNVLSVRKSFFACELGTELKVELTVKNQVHKCNTPAPDLEVFFRHTVYVPLLDHFVQDVEERFPRDTLGACSLFELMPRSTKTKNNPPMNDAIIRKIVSKYSGLL